jgi:histidinol-phosphate aminotransferase
MQSVKYSYNSYTMNSPSIILGCSSVEDDSYFRETRDKIVATRKYFTEELEKLDFDVIPSEANFVFAAHKTIPATEIFEKARAAGIYFRHFNQPRISNYLRITIGTREDMDTVLRFLSEM